MYSYHQPLPWLALVAGLLGGCGRGQPAEPPRTAVSGVSSVSAVGDSALPAEVLDVTWQWVSLTTSMEQVPVDAPDRYTVQFGRDGRVAVQADCNRGSASYSVSGTRRLVLGPLVLTRMACPAMSLSDRFAKEIGRITGYSLKDGELYLELPTDSGALRFRRQP